MDPLCLLMLQEGPLNQTAMGDNAEEYLASSDEVSE